MKQTRKAKIYNIQNSNITITYILYNVTPMPIVRYKDSSPLLMGKL